LFLAKLEEVKIPSPIRIKFANELKFIDTSSKKVEDAEDVEYSTLIRTTLITGALRSPVKTELKSTCHMFTAAINAKRILLRFLDSELISSPSFVVINDQINISQIIEALQLLLLHDTVQCGVAYA
jgi:hypothetical protein